MKENSKIKIIDKLLNLSIIFHLIYVGFEIFIYTFQIPITTRFLRGTGEFIFPTLLFILDIFRFLVHIVIVVILKQRLKNHIKNRVFEVVGIILYGGAFDFVYGGVQQTLKVIIAQQKGAEYMGRLSELTSIVAVGSVFCRLAFLLLIISCSISWYYKKYVNLENRDFL